MSTASKKKSAGILVYRLKKELEVFLVHPGGPLWKNKDEGAWSIPKGEFGDDEDPLKAAKREFTEETGIVIDGDFIRLDPVRQKSGKIVHAWAVESDPDTSNIISNTFELEWPPRSGKKINVPEVDRGEWFGISEAKLKINPGQVGLIEQLVNKLKS